MSTSPAPELPPLPVGVICCKCGYDLRGLTGNNCPECGDALDYARETASGVPWCHHSERGWTRTYWETVALVVCRTGLLAREMYRPVNYRDAQLFRWISASHLIVTLAVALPLLWYEEWGERFVDFFGEYTLVAGVSLAAAGVLWIIAATGLPSWLFWRRGMSRPQRVRAATLSYYCNGALALFPCVGLIFGLLAQYLTQPDDMPVVYLVAILLALLLLGMWWLSLVRCARATLRSRIATLKAAIGIPLLWLLGGVLPLVVPVIVIYIAIIINNWP